MINNWQVPRNKRKLYPVVDILSLFTLQNLGDVWNNDLARQLDFESELERYGIKRPGLRRDRKGGGARTYESWLYNLGLIFIETDTEIVRTTLAGEALLAGQPPVPIITKQLMKLQYPSPYSQRGRVDINSRFRIRPFRFLLRLLLDPRIEVLSKSEIGRFVITEGENETNACYEHVVQRILDYRINGEGVLPNDFDDLYTSSTTGVRLREKTIKYLEDIANTLMNYLEYTQFILRVGKGKIVLSEDSIHDVEAILNDGTSVRAYDPNHPYGNENFQRNFGLAPGQNRDNRTFGGETVTDTLYRQRRVRSELLHIAGIRPFTTITTQLVNEIGSITGFTLEQVEDAIVGFRPDTFSVFEASYLNMAISGRELDTEFELATAEVFELLGFYSRHVGNNPLHPDIFVESPENYSGIIDTKAYRRYSISNDHRNRMTNNYIPTYKDEHDNLEFFMYVADGFGTNINSQIQQIHTQSPDVFGSVITARNTIRILQRHLSDPISHEDLRSLFKTNRKITLRDIESL
ncbi:restriction endonuclease FokI C-terminal domain-containing protein [Oceanobacillus picturae]|uniref:restriction endonuclease FokI C-terminal domain-containing protein n=1 Tax=Oceanobacillus picturae TaxID=171693 RepID=UPI00363AD2D0